MPVDYSGDLEGFRGDLVGYGESGRGRCGGSEFGVADFGLFDVLGPMGAVVLESIFWGLEIGGAHFVRRSTMVFIPYSLMRRSRSVCFASSTHQMHVLVAAAIQNPWAKHTWPSRSKELPFVQNTAMAP